MEIEIEWTDEDIKHIGRHNISPQDIEELLRSRLYKKKRGPYLDLLGETLNGRILYVVIERKKAYRYRVAVARKATSSEKRLYVKRGK